jgi:hypothetical protein
MTCGDTKKPENSFSSLAFFLLFFSAAIRFFFSRQIGIRLFVTFSVFLRDFFLTRPRVPRFRSRVMRGRAWVPHP